MSRELKGKRLLFLGATNLYCEPIRYAKEMGIYTIATDYREDSPAKKVADKAYMISTTDVDGICELCKEERVDGLFVGFMEGMLPYAFEICKRMGFHFYASEEQIMLGCDKSFFRSKCIENGVPCPTDYSQEIAEKGCEKANICFPVIVKPVDLGGGRGISIAKNREELKQAVDKATLASPSKKIIVEEYMTGVEITATYTIKDGEVSLSRLGDKYISQDHEDCQSQGDLLLLPSNNLARYVEKVDPAIKSLLKSMGASNGTCFFQGIAGAEKIAMFECGYRPNCSCDYRHISQENGINYIKMMIAHAVSGHMDGYELSQDNPFFSKYVCTLNLWAHPGVIGSQTGLEETLAIENVTFAEFRHEIGDEITEAKPYQQAVYRAIIVDSDIEKIKLTILRIQEIVKVLNNENKSMLYKPFDVNRLA